MFCVQDLPLPLQVYVSSVTVGWVANDTESFVETQYLSLVPAQDGVDMSTPTDKVNTGTQNTPDIGLR